MGPDRRALCLLLSLTFGCGEEDAGGPSSGLDAAVLDSSAAAPDAASDADGMSADASEANGGNEADVSDAQTDADAEVELTLYGFPVADHCSPSSIGIDGDRDCSEEGLAAAFDSGIDPSNGMNFTVLWSGLDEPMVPGVTYGFSFELTQLDEPGWQLEVWGQMSACGIDGEPAVLLGSTPIDQGRDVYCLELVPDAAYTHLLYVYRHLEGSGGFARHGWRFCPSGSCPAP